MKSNQGVTIAELLIVLLIMVVLFSLALAAMQSGRASMQSAKCISRLRQTGAALFAYAGDHQQTIPTAYRNRGDDTANRAWATRLVYDGYVTDPDILYCPGFFPRSDAESDRKASVYEAVGPRSFGMRKWVEPGTEWLTSKLEEGQRLLIAITEPGDFFIVADSVWPPHGTQGYAISPGLSEHRVHLRHRGKANALFADGHVEAKPGSYFEELNRVDRQRRYTGEQDRQIYTTEQMKF